MTRDERPDRPSEKEVRDWLSVLSARYPFSMTLSTFNFVVDAVLAGVAKWGQPAPPLASGDGTPEEKLLEALNAIRSSYRSGFADGVASVTQPAPKVEVNDEELKNLAREVRTANFRAEHRIYDALDQDVQLLRAYIAKWGQPAPKVEASEEEIERFRFTRWAQVGVPAREESSYAMEPHKEGEWVRYSDALARFAPPAPYDDKLARELLIQAGDSHEEEPA